MRSRYQGFAIAATMAVALAVPAAAQGGDVASGLNSPRGIAIGPDGTIYVAEAGTGGDVACADHPELGHMCFGPGGTILAIKDGTATPLVDGLPSGLTDSGEAIGPSDVAVADDGTVWFLVGGPGVGAAGFRDSLENGAGDGIGHLYKVGPDGTAQAVADLDQYETDMNPDAAQPGNAEPDSNANSLAATPDGVLVADAGGNDLQLVAADGTISTIAVFPVQMQPAPVDPTASPDPSAEPAMIPMDPVPTSVVVGPDDAYYVGQLTGLPFPPGGASVFRVVPGEDPTVYATGFTNIMDLGFAADGSLYVLEIAKDSLINAGPDGPPAGGLWKIPPGGGDPEMLNVEGLVMPGGIAVADDGSLYITNCSACPAGAGSVINVTP